MKTSRTSAQRPCQIGCLWVAFLAALNAVSVAAAIPAETNSATTSNAAVAKSKPAIEAQRSPPTYSLSGGHIEIKPRLKYELILSLHILRCAEDHHRLFVPWAQRMRAALKPETLQQATNLNAHVHEWQLCSLLQDYDGPDTIQGLTGFLRQDADRTIEQWAAHDGASSQELNIAPKQFGAWFADLLKRYYTEGFGQEWTVGHEPLVRRQAAESAKALEALPFSITGFMEKHTGRKFTGDTKIIFYPSSFSRPQHAYGFSEQGALAVVYQVGGPPLAIVGTAFHELLHPLLRECWNDPNLNPLISALAQQPLAQTEAKPLLGSYNFPRGWVEELVVHALANHLSVKAGFYTEADARRQSYSSFETALYDSIFDRYGSFTRTDDFLPYALSHIQADEKNSRFRYVQEERQAIRKDPR